MIWIVSVGAALAEECDAEALNRAVGVGESAFATRNKEALVAAVEELDGLVGCQADVVPPEQAARVHGLLGMAAWIEGDVETTGAAFAAARSADMNYAFPKTAVPEGHPVRQAFDQAPGTLSTTTALPQGGGWAWSVDGRESLAYPLERPSIVQLDGPEAGLYSSTLLRVGGPAPQLPAAPPEPGADAATRQVPVVLVAGAVGLAAGAGALFGASHAAGNSYWESTSVAQAETQRGRVRGLTIASGASLGGAALLGGMAVVSVAF